MLADILYFGLKLSGQCRTLVPDNHFATVDVLAIVLK